MNRTLPPRWCSGTILAVLGAQFLAALADNALLIVAIALLEAGHAPGWATPALRVGFYAAYVVLAPFAGRWADAWRKDRLMAMVNAVKLCGAVALLAGAHPLLVFAAIGCGAAAYAPARYGILPELARGRALVQANAAMEIVTVAAILGGAALGAWLAGHASAGAACSALALLYALALACTLPARPRPAAAVGGAMRFRQGAAILLRDPAARHSLALTSIFWAAAAVLQFLMIEWARRTLGLPLARAALLPAVFALGMIGGALAAGRWKAVGNARMAIPSGMALGAAILLMPLAASVAAACALLLAAGLLAGGLLVPMNATLQQRGAALMQPGLSVAVQNFFENALSIVFLAAYGVALAAGVPLDATIYGLGTAVILLVSLGARPRLLLAWRLARVGAHLLSGLAQCALLFPLLPPARRGRLVERWSAQLTRLFGITVRVSGEPRAAGAVVANHVSWIDVFVLNGAGACRFVAKSEVRGWPAIGWLSARAGTVYIARNARSSLVAANAMIAQHLAAGERLAFFPEGTSGPQGGVLPFHANLFQGAILAGAPVLPAALAYTDEAGALSPAAEYIGDMSLWESIVSLLTHGPLFATVVLLPPIGAHGHDRRSLAAAAHAAVAGALAPAVPSAVASGWPSR